MGKRLANIGTRRSGSRHLRWENFESRIFKGPPSVEPVAGSPTVQMYIEPAGRRIGARFYTRKVLSVPSPLAEVSIREIGVGADKALEVSTGNSALYREFYSLCCTIADRVQIEKEPISTAVVRTLTSWAALLRKKSLLSVERQIGLIGELIFLQRVAKVLGWSVAARSWYGPDSEEHDFVLPGTDVEVKTTIKEHRVHLISSLTQLLPKERRRLQLLSVQLTPGADNKDARTLSEHVAFVLSSALQVDALAADIVRAQLQRQGWSDDDAQHYATRYYLRSKLLSVQVDSGFPAIIPSTLLSLGQAAVSRIGSVSYSINVEGLGVFEGTREFRDLLFGKGVRR